MELRKVIGRRRSIRFLLPHRPVELEKIQRMLEAARIASHWGNVQSLRALVIYRDEASQEVLDALPSPVGGYQIQLAPVVIVWYIETAAVDQIRASTAVGSRGAGVSRRVTRATVSPPVVGTAARVPEGAWLAPEAPTRSSAVASSLAGR